MKKLFILAATLISSLALAACGPNDIPSISLPTTEESTSTESHSTTDHLGSDDVEWPSSSSSGDEEIPVIPFTVYYFTSATSAVISDPFFKVEIPAGGLLPKPKADPICEDDAFNTFIGWSSKLFAMSEDDLWDFENDRLPDYAPGLEFFLYGQWDYVETEAN